MSCPAAQPLIQLGVVCLLLLCGMQSAQAHRMGIFAYRDKENCIAEVYFASSGPCKTCSVEVFDMAGKKLLDGKTDKEGQFSFKEGCTGDLKIVGIEAMGHRIETILGRDGIQAVEAKKASSEDLHGKVADPAIKQISLSKKPRARSQARGVEALEVISGLGLIAGIFAVLMLFYQRKKK